MRQTRTHLQNSIQDNKENSLDNVQQVFDRWEGRIVSEEYDAPTEISDTLSTSFEQEEEALALKMMLDELTDDTNTSDNNK